MWAQSARQRVSVALLIPAPRPRDASVKFTRIDGELVSMIDPNPEVLAIALPPASIARLELALREPRPRRCARRRLV
jgi:hypothetical protein